MIYSEKKFEDQRGSVLVMAAVLAFSVFLLGLAYLEFVNQALMETEEMVNDTQSYYSSVAGMTDGIVYTTIYEPGADCKIKSSKFYDNVYKNPPPHFITIENKKPIYREDFYLG
jgi:hypothetical protein